MFQSFSPNMLKTFEQCPKRFEFKYIKQYERKKEDTVRVSVFLP